MTELRLGRTEKQKRATGRNFTKLRLTGFGLDTTYLTEDERILYSRMKQISNELLLHWDENSKKVIKGEI